MQRETVIAEIIMNDKNRYRTRGEFKHYDYETDSVKQICSVEAKGKDRHRIN